jgi:LuxR family transcriptional regulator, maltose regulon positive regulatory protein
MQKKLRKNSILTTKLMPPAVGWALTARPRLLARTDDILAARLTVVRAPAGFGKSTLLVQWLEKLRETGVSAAWVSLDERDTDPANVLAQIIVSISRSAPIISPSTLALAQEFGLCEASVLMSHLIADVALHDAPVCLMLDDVHTLAADPVRTALTVLVDRAPSNLKIVLATREAPWIPLGRLRAFGQLFELSVDDLRFLTQECSDLLTHNGILGAPRKVLEEIGGKVEGWVVGLKFAMMTVRAAPGDLDRLADLSGRHEDIADFFTEEILAKHAPDYFDFLLQTSVLNRMSASLCDAVTQRSDSRQMLDRIVSEGLFIFSLDADRTWYRYHHLFGDFLLAEARRRDPARISRLHARASAWYEAHGLHAEAFHHLVESGDIEGAAGLFARTCEDMFCGGDIAAIFEWAGRLPAEAIARHPIIDLIVIWWLTVEWRFAEAERLLQRVTATVDAVPPDTPEGRRLRLEIIHRRANIDIFQEKLDDTSRIAAALSAQYDDAAPYIRATFPLMSLHAKMASLQLTGVAPLVEASYRDFQAAGASFSLVWHGAVSGAAYLLAGQTDEALEVLRDSIAHASRFGGVTGLNSLPAIGLAGVLYERNELAEARSLLNTHFDNIAYQGFVQQLIFGYATHARMAQIDGDWARSEWIIEKGLAFASARNFERMRLHMISEKVRMLALAGREDELQRLIATAGVYDPAALRLPGAGGEPANRTEIRALAWVRAARHLGHLTEALRIARRWRDFALNQGAVLSELQWRINFADLLLLDGDSR